MAVLSLENIGAKVRVRGNIFEHDLLIREH